MSDRPDRASGLLVHRQNIDVDELTKNIGMIRGVLRVVVVDHRRLMVVFEAEQRTGEDEYGPAIKAAVESMLDPDGTAEWIEDGFHDAVWHRVRMEAWDALCDVAKRVDEPSGLITGTGDEAVGFRVRRKFARMIQETAGEILSPKAPK